MAHGCLELDDWVCTAVLLCRQSLTVGTEVQVVADSALVADTSNIGAARFAGTKRSITIDAIIDLLNSFDLSDRLVQCSKSVSRVGAVSLADTIRTIVPVRAIQALVANAQNSL